MKGIKSIIAILAVGIVSTAVVAQRRIGSASASGNFKNRMAEMMDNDTLTFAEYTKQAKSSYDDARGEAIKRYVEYRDSVIADYVEAIKKPWLGLKSKPAAPKPKDNSIGPIILKENPAPKESPKPVVAPKDEPKQKVAPKEEVVPKDEPKLEVVPKEDVAPKDEPKQEVAPKEEPKPRDNGYKAPIGKIKVKKIVEIPKISPDIKPQPFVPIIIPEEDEEPELTLKYTFFGTEVGVSLDEDCRFEIDGSDNYSVADAIQEIADNDTYNLVLQQCLDMREQYHLCDWAYFQALTALGDAFLGKDTNEATLLTGYLFCMSGYKVRYAFDTADKLYNLVACDQYMIDRPYITLQNDSKTRYYVIGAPKDGDNRYYVCDYAMPKEKSMSLYISEEPRFAENQVRDLKLQLHSYPSIKFDYRINKNLIDFYNTYPAPLTEGDSYSKWGYYAMAPMSRLATETVYPAIRAAIKGKNQKAAVDIIMDMIETFEYGYDDKIWGYDRAFFPDETLFYPYSDCEDHAILLTRMVRDLLGLPTALIYYPGHLASAVCFSEPVAGDYIETGGRRYTICDATIYYAGVGITMRGMNNREAIMVLVK